MVYSLELSSLSIAIAIGGSPTANPRISKKHKIFRALGGQPFLKFNGMFVCLWCFDATALTTAKCWFLAKMEEARAATLGRGGFLFEVKKLHFLFRTSENFRAFFEKSPSLGLTSCNHRAPIVGNRSNNLLFQ